jgi:hypothetical protein
MPWELGTVGSELIQATQFPDLNFVVSTTLLFLARCSFGAGSPYIDTSHVIWLCTSNIGDRLVLDWNSKRTAPESPVSREEYVELMDVLRPVASDALGVRSSCLLSFENSDIPLLSSHRCYRG